MMNGTLSPVQHSSLDDVKLRSEKYIQLFSPSKAQLIKCCNSLLQELHTGLELHAKDRTDKNWNPDRCSLMMLDCCIDFVPTGQEKGIFYAVDFGGTSLRAIRCSLNGKGTPTIQRLCHNIRTSKVNAELPKGLLDQRATATMLFDDIAAALDTLIKEHGDSTMKDLGVGFTFSFGINQKSLTSATLTGWSKDFETGIATHDPVIGRDVCQLLDRAFERRKMNAKLSAVLNDTVGAMLSGNYSKTLEEPPCLVGMILGTGMNGCYVQPDAKTYGYQGIVINTELGGFDKDLPENEIDRVIDFNSLSPGRQRFEKMCSGMYLPEISRLLILRVFQNAAPAGVWIPNTLTGEGCGVVFSDSPPYTTSAKVFSELWFWNPSSEELQILHDLVSAVFRRSAAVSAVAIAAMSQYTGRLQPAMGGLTVGVDGTLYVHNPSYQLAIREYLEVVLTKPLANLVNIVIAEDGSGTGAAILAATVACASRK